MVKKILKVFLSIQCTFLPLAAQTPSLSEANRHLLQSTVLTSNTLRESVLALGISKHDLWLISTAF